MSFYLGYDDKITNLFNIRLFSLGIQKNKNKDKNNSDLKLFEEHLNNINFKTIFQTKKSFSEINLEEDEEITTEKKKINEDSSLKDLISNNNIINVLKRFENQMKIIIKGEIPDKIVKYAFFIILHHETLLEIFINYCQDENQQKESENILNKNIFYVILERCSDLRRTYKEIKDNLINQNLEITNTFNFIFEKLKFLYSLNPEIKINKTPKKINQIFSKQLNQIINEHIINITQLIMNKDITIDNN